MLFTSAVCAAVLALVAPGSAAPLTPANSTYTNPIFPGWNSDPSCVFVPEYDNTFFCTVSTFLAFPGLPIYASKDLINWKHISSAFNRPSQHPELGTSTDQQAGVYAPTLRYRNGVFYNVVVTVPLHGLIFTTTDPFSSAAWSDPVRFTPDSIDADLFWDDDVSGQAYITYAGITQSAINLTTGATTTPATIWNGTGGASPEGPHIYKKDGHYYLMIAEGGTELGHSETIARAPTVSGPYQSYPDNPILTNRNSDNYFQTVGHADLFPDAEGQWWGVALSTRSGPAWRNYPMGRETVLFPATWAEGQWPVLQPVRGRMSGWPLPPPTREIAGDGSFLGDPDVVDFGEGEALPGHFLHWRFPSEGAFVVSPAEAPGRLRIVPERVNLTAGANYTGGLGLVARKQTDTLFAFGVDVEFEFEAGVEGEEAGVTAFLTQDQHVDLGVVVLPAANGSGALVPSIRFRVEGSGNADVVPEEVVLAVPQRWRGQGKAVRLEIRAVDETLYAFSAGPADGSEPVRVISYAPATLLSGDTGRFTGTLVGAYATSNGGEGATPAYIGRWRYTGLGQAIGNGEIVPS